MREAQLVQTESEGAWGEGGVLRVAKNQGGELGYISRPPLQRGRGGFTCAQNAVSRDRSDYDTISLRGAPLAPSPPSVQPAHTQRFPPQITNALKTYPSQPADPVGGRLPAAAGESADPRIMELDSICEQVGDAVPSACRVVGRGQLTVCLSFGAATQRILSQLLYSPKRGARGTNETKTPGRRRLVATPLSGPSWFQFGGRLPWELAFWGVAGSGGLSRWNSRGGGTDCAPIRWSVFRLFHTAFARMLPRI